MSHFIRSFTLAIVFVASGCSLESDSEDEALGEASAAFSTYSIQAETGVNGTADTDHLSAGSNDQAFISGVWGNFGHGSYVESAIGGGFWDVQAVPGGTDTLAVYGYKVNASTAGAVSSCNHSGAGSGARVALAKPSGGGNYACFLTQVKSLDGTKFASTNDIALVSYEDLLPATPDGVVEPYLTCSGNSAAAAQCFSYTTWINSGSSSGNFGPLSLGTAVSGEVCGFRGIAGVFRTNTSVNGVSTYFSGTDWWVQSYTNEAVWVDCVK